MQTATTTKAIPDIEFTPAPPEGQMPVLASREAPPANLPEPVSILNVIAKAAADPNTDVEKMDRLLQMQERILNKQAQVEFDTAMKVAQEAMKRVRANLYNKQTQSHYADYAQLDKAVRPIYSKNGFSLSFDTGEGAPDNCVRIVCNVAHTGGHRERRQLDMPADGKGAKGGDVMTKTHATGAAITYGKRYLLGMIFNLAIGADDDGNSASWNQEIDRMANGPRDEDGNPLSTYDVEKVKKAQEWADAAIQRLNTMSGPVAAQEARAWRDEANKVPPRKKKSPLQWLKDNSPGQYLRVRQVYQNVTGEDLE